MVSCPVAQFLRPGCTDSLAGWLSSLCSERLANNLSAPVGYEASMSITGPVFHSTAMEIRRTKGSKGERVIFLGLSQGGKDCPDCVLQLSWPFGTDGWGTSGLLCLPATVHYPLARRHKAPTRLSISSHQDTCDVLLIKRTSMFCLFFQFERCCATMFPPMQVKRLTHGNLQYRQTRETLFEAYKTKHVSSHSE